MRKIDKTTGNVLLSTVDALWMDTTTAVICVATDTKLKKSCVRTLNDSTGAVGLWSETSIGASNAASAAVAMMIQTACSKGGIPANKLIYPTKVSYNIMSDTNATIVLLLLLKADQYSFKD